MPENQGKRTSQARTSDKQRRLTAELLPAIPDKRYFTIGEVGRLCGVKPHVLRYWEQEFSQIKPVKRRGNRRYYQLNDILTIRKIRNLLYDEGFTIEGARAQLLDNPDVTRTISATSVVKKLIVDLEIVLTKLKSEETA